MANVAPGGGGSTPAPPPSTASSSGGGTHHHHHQGSYTPSHGGKLNFSELIALARHVGFSRAQAVVMASIAMAESGGKVNINNAGLNSDGSIDYGLWQINSSHGLNSKRLQTDPLYNARAAFKVFKEQGLGAWATYSSGAYTQYLGQARHAAGNISMVNIREVTGRNYGTALEGGAPAGNNEFSKQDLAGMLNNLGLPKALINSNASLKKAFHKIVSQQLDLSTDAGQGRAMAIFKNTAWWQNHSASQRKFITMQYDDPKEFDREITQKTRDLSAVAQQLGIGLSGDELAHLGHLALFNGLDETEIQKALAGHFQYKQGKTYTGQAGTDVMSLQALASDYYMRMDPDRMESMVQRMLAGGLDPNAVKDYFIQQAIQRMPHLTKQLQSGMTVGDIASPYLNAMSQLLEVAPTSIKPNDKTIMQALQASDGKGGFQLMPEWQFEDQLRNDPRWLNTNNARDSLLGIGHDLLKSFGLAV